MAVFSSLSESWIAPFAAVTVAASLLASARTAHHRNVHNIAPTKAALRKKFAGRLQKNADNRQKERAKLANIKIETVA
jgi:hypothetical protein